MSTQDSCLGIALDTWLTRLDSEGFQVGVRERLLVQTLLARLSAEGELSGAWSLQDMLGLAGPLLCTHPEQQRRYTTLLNEFVAHPTDVDDGAWQAQLKSGSKVGGKPWRFRWWYVALVVLLICALGFGLWSRLKPDVKPSVSTYDRESEIPFSTGTRPIYVPLSSLTIELSLAGPIWTAPARIGLLVLFGTSLFGFAWLAWTRWRRQLYLQGTSTDKEVEERLLTDPKPVKIEPAPSLIRRASRTMRERYAGDRKVLDVPATLRTTMSAGGAMSPRFRPLTQTPEYLVLIDQRHPVDHHTAYSESLVAALRENDISVQTRYFEGSPQTGCWRIRYGPRGLERFGLTSFSEVAARFTGHRLLVFAETDALVDEGDGSLRNWVNYLKAFPQRAWFTPMPLASWGQLEQVADSQGFLVLPVQPESLNTMAGWFSAGQLRLEVGADWPLSYPPILRGEAVAWVVRQDAPPSAVQEDLLFQLRNYLGAQRFQWLCACSIFPAISPAITFALGRELVLDARDLALGAAAIGALPWFRHAFMPTWLRLVLINRLDEFHDKRFRELTEERLAAALEGSSGALLLTLAERRRRLSAWFHRRRGPARDVVLVSFLHRGPLSRLAQRLPEGLRGRLYRHGMPAYGLTNGALWALAIGLLLGVLGFPGIWDRVGSQLAPTIPMIGSPLMHKGPVYSAAFSPDGQRLVSLSDKTARLWDAVTGKELAVLSGHDGYVWSAAFSPDGQRLLTASSDKTARLWDVATSKQLTQLAGHDDQVTAVAFSPDGQRLLTASLDSTMRLWDAVTGKQLLLFRSHETWVSSTAFSADGQRLLTASRDMTARLWDAATGKELARFLHQDWVNSAAFSPDGQHLVTASSDKTARLWDVATGIELVRFPHQDWVNSAAFSPDGQHLVTASNDGTARLWDVARGIELARILGDTGIVRSAVFSPDGQRLVTASNDGTARLWGQPHAPALDLVDCRSGRGVTDNLRSLADRVAESVRSGALPPLAPVAYVPRAWHPPTGDSRPEYGMVLYGAEAGRATAEALAKWLTDDADHGTQTTQERWKVDLAASLAGERFVVNTCAAQPQSTSAENKTPARMRGSEVTTLANEGYAFYGQSGTQRYFRKVSGDPLADPEVGDIVEVTGAVNIRKGYIEFHEGPGWVNKEVIGVLQPKTRVQVIEVRDVAAGFTWMKFTRLSKEDVTSVEKPRTTAMDRTSRGDRSDQVRETHSAVKRPQSTTSTPPSTDSAVRDSRPQTELFAQTSKEIQDSDAKITAMVQAKLRGTDYAFNFGHVEITTEHGIVSLGGVVASADEKVRAEALTRQLKGINRVNNNLQIHDPNASLRGAVEAKLRGFSYVRVKTYGGTVYLNGTVDTEEEKDSAPKLAREVDGVTEVHSNLMVVPREYEECITC